MKPFAKSLRSKKSWKCSKTMRKGLLADKWDKHMNANLKKSKEGSRYAYSWKFINEYKQMEFELEGCKVHKVLTVSKKVEIRAMGARTLVVCVNSFAHPRAKLCSSRQAWGRMGVGFREGTITTRAQFVNSVTTSAYAWKRCSTWIMFMAMDSLM